jgi:hypothetical protein
MARTNSQIEIPVLRMPWTFFWFRRVKQYCDGETFLFSIYTIGYPLQLYFAPCYILIPNLLGLDGNLIGISRSPTVKPCTSLSIPIYPFATEDNVLIPCVYTTHLYLRSSAHQSPVLHYGPRKLIYLFFPRGFLTLSPA